jgi:outer membrane protein
MAQELKLGVVNVPVLMEQAPQAKVALDALQEEFAPRQRNIVARQKELEDLSAKVQRDLAVMGETERRNAEMELRDLQRDVARLQNEFREDLNLRRNEELGNLQRSLLKEVQDYAQTAGFDLVVGDGVLYASSAINITETVLRAMEENFQAAGNR